MKYENEIIVPITLCEQGGHMNQKKWFPIILMISPLTFSLSIGNSAIAREWKGTAEITVYAGGSLLDLERSGPDFVVQHPGTEPMIWPDFLQFQSSLTGSPMFGFKVGYNATDTLAVEGNFALAPSHTLKERRTVFCQPGFPCPLEDVVIPEFQKEEDITSYHYDIDVVYHFTREKVRPYVAFGIGGVSYDVPEDFETNFTFNVGLGLKLFIHRVGFRFEFREHVIPDHFMTGKTASNPQVQVGLVFQPNL